MLVWQGAVHFGDLETNVWCIGKPPVIYVGGWLLNDDESGMLHGQHIHAVVVETMVKTFWRWISICSIGMQLKQDEYGEINIDKQDENGEINIDKQDENDDSGEINRKRLKRRNKMSCPDIAHAG